MTASTSLYGPGQSRFARFLERREQRRPDPVARELRTRLLAGIRGAVIEIGAGDGRSFEHYPPTVGRLLAVEPDPVARDAAAERARAAAPRIEVAAGVAEALPAPNASFDAAVVMGVLCSVPDVSATLAEIRRVLVPSGELRLWEHVRSGNPAFRLVQRAADRLFWTRSLGLRDDTGYGSGNPGRRLRDRAARARVPLLIAAHHPLRAVRARRRPPLDD